VSATRSQLQDHILWQLAKLHAVDLRLTVDEYINSSEVDRFDDSDDVRYRRLFESVADYWPLEPERSYERQRRSHLVSFSRAVNQLVADPWVCGLSWALCETSNWDVIRWAGGGRRVRESDGYRRQTPRLAYVHLTDLGRKLLRVAGADR
jgi:hypothetical protein